MTNPLLQRLKQDLKNDLIAGLLVIIPLATTIWLTIAISRWVVEFLTRIPKQLNPFDGFDPFLVNVLNLVVGLTVPLLSILLIGLMARNIVGRWLLDLGENIVQAIPLAGAIYKTLKQLLTTLLQDSGDKFRRVILIEYPRQGIWALAFVTGTIASPIQAKVTEPLLSVFVPTTPNPTTGWYAIIPEREVVEVDISVEDAFKIVISGGIVSPTEALNGDEARSLARRSSLDRLLTNKRNTNPATNLSMPIAEAVSIEIEEDFPTA